MRRSLRQWECPGRGIARNRKEGAAEGYPYQLLRFGTTVGYAWRCPQLRRPADRIFGFRSDF